MCQAVRAPGLKVTLAPWTRAGSNALNSGSMRTVPVNHSAAPLADGWQDRVPLHQLHPLLVHAVLFGGTYGSRAAAAAQAALEPRQG